MTGSTPTHHKSVFDKILDTISLACIIVTGVSLVVLTAIFGWLVFGRYVLNSTPTWVEQVALLLVGYISFLGAAVGIHHKTHLGVAVFCELSPRPVQRIFAFVSHTLLCLFGLVMVIYGYKLTQFKWDTEIPLLHISEGVRTIPMILSGSFIFLFSIGHLIHFFGKKDQSCVS
ncbi:MAG: TRAP transporter small permease [Desulfovibrio sp.]|nr:MAG: TRAP transporter small permease [Desulfovibrio sp.]